MDHWLETNESLILRVKHPADAASWSDFLSIYRPELLGWRVDEVCNTPMPTTGHSRFSCPSRKRSMDGNRTLSRRRLVFGSRGPLVVQLMTCYESSALSTPSAYVSAFIK